jgi:hypothetical protein
LGAGPRRNRRPIEADARDKESSLIPSDLALVYLFSSCSRLASGRAANLPLEPSIDNVVAVAPSELVGLAETGRLQLACDCQLGIAMPATSTIRLRKLNAARIARYRARARDGRSVFKVEAYKEDIILSLRGGINEFILTRDASREEIAEKLSLLLGQITDRWRDYFGINASD